MSEQNDNELLDKIEKGDEAAFRELVERYQRKVYSICYGVLKNHEEAMDASQEVFVKVYQQSSRFNRDSTFYTWLYRVARNHSIDRLRKSQRNQELAFDEALDSAEGDPLELVTPHRLGVNPAEGLDRAELRDEMLKALESLSENHRSILILREVEGLSYEEIASVIGVSKGTVMSRLFHARRNFQRAIIPYLQDGTAQQSINKE